MSLQSDFLIFSNSLIRWNIGIFEFQLEWNFFTKIVGKLGFLNSDDDEDDDEVFL